MRIYTILFLVTVLGCTTTSPRYSALFGRQTVLRQLYQQLKGPHSSQMARQAGYFNLNAPLQKNATMLMVAAQDPDVPTEGLKFLLTHGADPDLRDSAGRTVMHYCVDMEHADDIHTVDDQIKTIVKKIIALRAAGARLNPRDRKGTKPEDLASDEIIVRCLQESTHEN